MTARDARRTALELLVPLGLSLLLLVAALAAWGGRGAGARRAHRLDGFTLALSGASGGRSLGGLRIDPVPAGARATALRRGLELDAAQWRHAELELAGEPSAVLLLWSTSTTPGRTFGTPLLRRGARWRAQWLASRPEWSGRIVALGVGLPGPSGASVEIRALTLEPVSPGAALRGVAHDWSGFEGLDGHSQNFVIGGDGGERPLLRPAPAAAAWAAIALLLHFAWVRRRGRRVDPWVVAGVVVAAWLALDARWQLDLWRQHQRTAARFAGLEWPARREAAEDGALFRFCEQLKRLLPETPRIVYVITRDPEGADRYLQIRARYHLFPHDVASSYAHPPPPGELHPESYLVVFTPRDDIGFDAATSELVWDPAGRPLAPGTTPQRLAVTRLHASSLGALYRIR